MEQPASHCAWHIQYLVHLEHLIQKLLLLDPLVVSAYIDQHELEIGEQRGFKLDTP